MQEPQSQGSSFIRVNKIVQQEQCYILYIYEVWSLLNSSTFLSNYVAKLFLPWSGYIIWKSTSSKIRYVHSCLELKFVFQINKLNTNTTVQLEEQRTCKCTQAGDLLWLQC